MLHRVRPHLGAQVMSNLKKNNNAILVPVACKYGKKYESGIQMLAIWHTFFVEAGRCDMALLSQFQGLQPKAQV